ncbi:MAG: hypothetical protein JW384_02158 [Nitrosomonadaceae bacterium]|nr:hypothetical protein [Nitrosomonadaceae bacterium]
METHGIPIDLQWDLFQISTSFFVPGVDRQGLEKHLRGEMHRLAIRVVTRQVVENDILGVRVWRVP